MLGDGNSNLGLKVTISFISECFSSAHLKLYVLSGLIFPRNNLSVKLIQFTHLTIQSRNEVLAI